MTQNDSGKELNGLEEELERGDGDDMEAGGDSRGLGKLDSDLDTEEEGDDEVGFEIAEDDDDDDDDD